MEENTNTEKTEAEGLEEERKEILDIQNQLLAMWGFLDDVYSKTFEIESAEATKTESVESFTERFNEIISKLTERADQAGVALAEKQTTLETLQTELDALKAEVETFRAEKAEAEKNARIATREKELAEANITLEDANKESILSLDDTAFSLFVSALKQVNRSIAETRKIQLPDISGGREYTAEEIAAAHKEAVKSKRR